MTEVKLVISYLCKVFNGLFNDIIKPEYFRYSKFDKTSEEVVSVLWRLLHNLCCSSTSPKDKKCAFDDIVTCVKLVFASMKYSCVTFYNLPANMASGSRELLLALGWYLSTHRLQQLIQQFVSKSLLQEEYPPHSGKDVVAVENVDLKSEEEIINYINWVSGRIKNNIAFISNLSTELVTLTSRVHGASEGAFGLGTNLSVQEVLLLKDHSLITQRLLDDCKLTISLLENYLLWTKQQNVFWTWMESVVKEEERDKLANNNVNCRKEFDKFIQILKAEIRKQALKDDDVDDDNSVPLIDVNRRMLHMRTDGGRDATALNTLINDVNKSLEKLKLAHKTKCNLITRSCKLITDGDRQDGELSS